MGKEIKVRAQEETSKERVVKLKIKKIMEWNGDETKKSRDWWQKLGKSEMEAKDLLPVSFFIAVFSCNEQKEKKIFYFDHLFAFFFY